MANGTRFDERADRGSQRAGAAGDDHVPIAIVHGCSPDGFHLHSSPMLRRYAIVIGPVRKDGAMRIGEAITYFTNGRLSRMAVDEREIRRNEARSLGRSGQRTDLSDRTGRAAQILGSSIESKALLRTKAPKSVRVGSAYWRALSCDQP